MASYTTNYNLKKPAAEDFYDVKDFNDNADAIDTALSEKAEIEELAKRVPVSYLTTSALVNASGRIYFDFTFDPHEEGLLLIMKVVNHENYQGNIYYYGGGNYGGLIYDGGTALNVGSVDDNSTYTIYFSRQETEGKTACVVGKSDAIIYEKPAVQIIQVKLSECSLTDGQYVIPASVFANNPNNGATLVNLYYDSSPTTTGNVIYKWGSNAERSIYNFGGLLNITSGEIMRSNVTIFFPQVASGETPFGYVIARMVTA